MRSTGVVDLAVLGELVPFRDCGPDDLAEVSRLTRLVHAAPGEQLTTHGADGSGLFVVVDGTVRVRRPGGLDGVLGPGDVVGEMAALGGEPSTADVVVDEPSTLLVADPDNVAALLAIPMVQDRLRAIAGARAVMGHRGIVEAASVPVVVPPPRVRGIGAGLHARRRLPSRPVRLVLVTLLSLGLAGGAYLATELHRATVEDLDTLLAEIRDDDITGEARVEEPVSVVATGPDPATPGAPEEDETPASSNVTQPVAVDALPAPVATPQPAVGPSPVAVPSPSAPDPVAHRFQRPAVGIYTYATTGSERISVLGASHQYPEETHAIVRHTSCGWIFEHRILKEHIDTQYRCTAADVVSMALYRTDIEFLGQRDGVTYHCDPPVPLAWTGDDAERRGSCRSEEGDEMTSVVTALGDETIMIGGQAVQALRGRLDVTMTGKSTGTSTTEAWVHPDTGLLLRFERSVDTRANSLWGDVRYEEQGTFQLVSLTPRT